VNNFLKKKTFFTCFFEKFFVNLRQKIDFFMYSFEIQLSPRYSETDQMGYVYYGNYAAYYEQVRSESMRGLETSYPEMEQRGVMLPCTEMHIKYLKAARYDELLTVKMTLTEMPVTRLFHSYEIYNEQGELLNKGTTVLVFVDSKTMKPCRCPEWFAEKLRPYFVK
jgi:acyl-CoA thioester hydrolase